MHDCLQSEKLNIEEKVLFYCAGSASSYRPAPSGSNVLVAVLTAAQLLSVALHCGPIIQQPILGRIAAREATPNPGANRG